jgi:hypothetical protein
MDSSLAIKSAAVDLAAQARAQVAPLIDWLLAERIGLAHSPELFSRFCERLGGTGVPLDRATIHIPQLHPQLRARSMLWTSDGAEVVETGRAHGIEIREDYLVSPVRRIFDGGPAIRRLIGAPDSVLDFPILEEAAAWSTPSVSRPSARAALRSKTWRRSRRRCRPSARSWKWPTCGAPRAPCSKPTWGRPPASACCPARSSAATAR